ncbi:hypothetical protein Adu01nite_66590 [Paractinoplanes durhamensis]|uniref:Uncharacterized protein n=1 Tax=Paractinoplanes durhamensis TaxID=113563 RepID=A0ABQ3Z6Z7_9ACTN|nr:hypothetical protein Adu01nite_66590 [Actinoplanes durhamensis]
MRWLLWAGLVPVGLLLPVSSALVYALRGTRSATLPLSVWGVSMLKKLLIVAGIVGAAALVIKKVKASSDERALWHEATTAPDLR